MKSIIKQLEELKEQVRIDMQEIPRVHTWNTVSVHDLMKEAIAIVKAGRDEFSPSKVMRELNENIEMEFKDGQEHSLRFWVRRSMFVTKKRFDEIIGKGNE